MLESRTGIVCENMQGLGAKLRKLRRQAKICTPPGAVEVICVSCLDMLDMSEHVPRHVRTRWTQVPCMRKYALETSPGADCENMRSAKITLSPYGPALLGGAHIFWERDYVLLHTLPPHTPGIGQNIGSLVLVLQVRPLDALKFQFHMSMSMPMSMSTS